MKYKNEEAFIFDEIKDYITKNSYFEFEGYEHGKGEFATRQYGNVSNCQFGAKDFNEAVKLKTELSKRYKGKNVNISIDTCDEWVNIYVETPRAKTIEITYLYSRFNPIEKRGGGSYLGLPQIKDCVKRDLNMDYIEFYKLLSKLENMITTKESDTLSSAEIELGAINGVNYSLKRCVTICE